MTEIKFNPVPIPAKLLPTFPKVDCIDYFKKILGVTNPKKLPDHIPKFNEPSIEFELGTKK